MLTKEELAARQFGFGGSDAAAYCGVSKWKSRLQLVLEKRGEIPISDEETEAMYWGSVFEQPILDRWSALTGIKIRRSPKRTHKEFSYLSVNMDAVGLNHPRGPIYVEAKNFEHAYGIKTVADLPPDVYLQGQHGLMVTGYPMVAFAIRAAGRMVDPEQMFCERDEPTIAKMMEAARYVWEELICKGQLPEPDGSESCEAMLAHLYPTDKDARVLMLDDPAIKEKAIAYQVTKIELDAAEAAVRAIKNRLKWHMADASELVIPTWGKFTWKKSKDGVFDAVDLKKLREQFPDAFAACYEQKKRSGARVFLMRPDKDDL